MTEKTLQNCGKCGLCLNVCPVYKQLKEEQASPRARLQLIKKHKNKNVDSSPLLKEIMSKCLMCGSCTAMCPSGIDHYSAFMEMRQKMVHDHGDSPAIKSLIYLLAREYRIRMASGIARSGQKILPEFLARKYRLGHIPVQNFPVMNTKPFRDACGTRIMPDGPSKGCVAYFTGCATNYLFDDTGFSTVGALTHMGFEVIIPDKQTCCSVPLLFHGARDKAGKNIESNINALNLPEVSHIIVDCSTCGEALKHLYPKICEDRGRQKLQADKIAGKTVDILSFINERFELLDFDLTDKEKQRVSYHMPCHSKNRFQSGAHAENLIKKLPFLSYQRTIDADECCGGGGTFFYEFPDISKKMMTKKISSVKTADVSKWLTDCPVCRINLAGSLPEEDPLDVLHPVTLIYSALKKS